MSLNALTLRHGQTTVNKHNFVILRDVFMIAFDWFSASKVDTVCVSHTVCGMLAEKMTNFPLHVYCL